ncbi:MAG TPA: serine/threonine-protein kinase [Oligoflexia bacterium]|nr:serine/threonine-protein kinase [Oligoflexia bacterium]HMP47080.1 serine/threonine-protein kinase [Oligoflexia bacterium]
MAVDQPLNLKAGMVLQGKYEIVRCLGAGSMGMVYAVKHLDLQGRILALKVLFSDVAKDEVQAARFKNEIVASYEVNHPHVVRAYDYFREGDMVGYTMEFVSGGDLADRLGEDELLPIDQILLMLKQMASGVQAIHDAGIIHRDLKPENILLTDQGDVKITDFGIARNLKGPRLTDHGGIVGTFAYVSPEYLEHGKVDARSDIYSLGVLAYEMVTGEAPYVSNNVIEEMHLRLTTDPRPPVELRKDCPVALSKAIKKALSRDPGTRFSSAKEFYDALSAVQIGESDTFSQLRKDFVEESRMPEMKPKVLESDLEYMLQDLKDSLEDRAAIKSGVRFNEQGNQSEGPLYSSTFKRRDDLYSPIASDSSAYIVPVSRGSLSVDKIKQLEKGLKKRDSDEISFEALGWAIFRISVGIFTVLSGLLLGIFLVRFLFPEMYSSAEDVILKFSGF